MNLTAQNEHDQKELQTGQRFGGQLGGEFVDQRDESFKELAKLIL
jgi:hypothetical protein